MIVDAFCSLTSPYLWLLEGLSYSKTIELYRCNDAYSDAFNMTYEKDPVLLGALSSNWRVDRWQ